MTSLWRLRKRNHRVDAHLADTGSGRVEIRFDYDGRPVFVRQWRTRRSALAHALKKRRELERAGWVDHW
jgi:hypothetical protein